MDKQGEIILYQPDETIRLEVKLEDETVWLTQAQMSELFQRDQSVIARHIGNIFKEGELEEKSNMHFLHIVVAKTFKPATQQTTTTPADNGFYLRDLIDDFRSHNNSEFLKISDLDYLQILAVIINHNVPNSGVRNITDRYLNEIKTEHILVVWEETEKAMLKTFDFFENHLHIKTPYLIPFRYFYFTITAYFYKNSSPDYGLLKKYFWFNSFHNDDLLSN